MVKNNNEGIGEPKVEGKNIIYGIYNQDKAPTEEYFLEQSDADGDRWMKDKFKVGFNDVSMKLNDTEIHTVRNWNGFLVMKRRYEEEAEWTYDAMIEIMKRKGVPEPIVYKHTAAAKKALAKVKKIGVVLLADLHVNKKNTAGETMDETLQRYEEGLAHMDNMFQVMDIQKVLFVNMGDFFNTDSNSRTSNDTLVQNNVDEREAFIRGSDWFIGVLDDFKQRYQVELLSVLGNHDRIQTSNLHHMLKRYFQDDERVDVINDADFRQYYPFGEVLLAFGHGKNEQLKNFYQGVYAEYISQVKDSFKRVYAYIGHLHDKAVMEHGMITTERVKSPNYGGERDKKKMYELNHPAMQGCIHDMEGNQKLDITYNYNK